MKILYLIVIFFTLNIILAEYNFENNLIITTFSYTKKSHNDLKTFKDYFHEIPIYNNSLVFSEWIFKAKSSFFTDSNVIYENEGTFQRYFRIENSYQEEEIEIKEDENEINEIENNSLIINSIKVNYNQEIMSPKISELEFPLIIQANDSLDFLIEYNCLPGGNWGVVEIILETSGKTIKFSYMKICDSSYKAKINNTYFLLMICFVSLCYILSLNIFKFNEYFNLDDLIHIKNSEQIFVFSFILIGVIIFISILSLFKKLSFLVGFILLIITMKYFLEYLWGKLSKLINNFNFTTAIELRNIHLYVISFIINILGLIYYSNILLNNIIFVSLVYSCLKVKEYRNFYIIIFFYVVTIIYDIYWLLYEEIKFKSFYNLNTNLYLINPIIFRLPDLIDSPFNTEYFFSFYDLFIICLLIDYNKKQILNENYFKLCLYSLILGILFNIILFYSFYLYIPMFIFPGVLMLISVIAYSIYNHEFYLYSHLDYQIKKGLNPKFPLLVIGADSSDNFSHVLSFKKEYIPPQLAKFENIKEVSAEKEQEK